MMVDHVVALVRPEHDRDHVLAEQFGALLLRFMLAPALALLFDLAHPHRHLGRAQGQDGDRLDIGFADIRHGRAPWRRDRSGSIMTWRSRPQDAEWVLQAGASITLMSRQHSLSGACYPC